MTRSGFQGMSKALGQVLIAREAALGARRSRNLCVVTPQAVECRSPSFGPPNVDLQFDNRKFAVIPAVEYAAISTTKSTELSSGPFLEALNKSMFYSKYRACGVLGLLVFTSDKYKQMNRWLSNIKHTQEGIHQEL